MYAKLVETSRGTGVRPSLVLPMLAQSLHAQGKLKEAEKRLSKCLDLCFGVDGDPEEDYEREDRASPCPPRTAAAPPARAATQLPLLVPCG